MLPNGFRFLSTETNGYWCNAMAKKKATNKKEMTKEVRELIDHLRLTGTGEAKLQKLAAIDMVAEDAEEFLLTAKAEMPEGTWEKIEKYVKARQDENNKALLSEKALDESEKEPEEEDEEEEDNRDENEIPTKDLTAADAIKKIHDNKFVLSELRIIAGFDTRKSVQEAAEKKIAVLEEEGADRSGDDADDADEVTRFK